MNVDSRYDAVLVENTNGIAPDVNNLNALTVPWMPVRLLRDRGKLGFTRTKASPIAGGMGEGDQQESTLGGEVSLSQRDWSGGLLERATMAATNRYWGGMVDARYAGRFTLPPKVYGPYEIRDDITTPTSPVTIGSAETVRARWVTYLQRMYVIAGGKLWVSVFDENAVSGGVMIPRWQVAASDVNTVAATDIDLLLQSGTYKLLVTGSNGIAAFDPSTGVLSSVPGNVAQRLKVLGRSTLAQAYAQQFVIGNAPAAPADLVSGDNTISVNGFVSLGGVSYILCNQGIWKGSGAGNQVLDWREYADDSAGSVCTVWRGKAYIGLGDTVQVWDGSSSTLIQVGLDREASVPSDVAKRVTWLEAGTDTLYAATGETNKRSGIFAMTGDGVWHCLWLASNTTDKVNTLGIDMRSGRVGGGTNSILNAQARLWWAIGNKSYYMYVGRNESGKAWISDMVSGTYYRGFASSGELITSRWGGKFARVRKRVRGLVLRHEAWDTAQPDGVQAELSVDDGPWVALSRERYDSALHLFRTHAGAGGPWAVVSGGSLQLTLISSTGLSVGQFLRTGAEVVQVAAINGNVITLARATSQDISTGAILRPARPSGYEFQVKITLSSSDSRYTPEVTRVSVLMGYELIRKERFTVHMFIQDGLKDRDNGFMPHETTEAIDDEIKQWLARDNFWLITPDGKARIVECINAAEAQYTEQQVEGAGVIPPWRVLTMSLIEVEQAI
ncbi:MAG: hypothetical protein ACKN9T_02360 [Candidatus Methylumidiphilus sp.]